MRDPVRRKAGGNSPENRCFVMVIPLLRACGEMEKCSKMGNPTLLQGETLLPMYEFFSAASSSILRRSKVTSIASTIASATLCSGTTAPIASAGSAGLTTATTVAATTKSATLGSGTTAVPASMPN